MDDPLSNMPGYFYPGTNPSLYSGNPTPTTYGANPAYSYNPSYQSGTGAFGQVPGAIGAPNPFANLAGVVPGLGGINANLSTDLMAKLSGQLSPSTINAIKDAGAAWGVGSGQVAGGAGSIGSNRDLREIGLNTEQQIQQGIQDYSQTIPTIARTQTVSPELQTQIAEINAINAAAPNPQAQASYALQLFNSYLNRMRGGGSRAPGEVTPDARAAFANAGPPSGWPGVEAAPTNYYQQLAGM